MAIDKTYATEIDYLVDKASSAGVFDREVYDVVGADYLYIANQMADTNRLDLLNQKEYRYADPVTRYEFILNELYTEDEEIKQNNRAYFADQAQKSIYTQIYNDSSTFSKIAASTTGVLANAVNELVLGTAEGLVDLVQLIGGQDPSVIAQDTTGYRAAQKTLQEFSAKYTAIDKDNVVGFINDAVTGIVKLAPIIVGGTLTAGASLPAQIAVTALTQGAYWGSMAGNTAETAALQKPDITWGELAGYTALSLAIEVVSEIALPGGAFKKGVFKLGSFKTAITRLAGDAIGEAMEEMFAEVAGGILEQAMINPDAKTTLNDVLYAGLVGAAVGVGATGGRIAGTTPMTGMTRMDTFLFQEAMSDLSKEARKTDPLTTLQATKYSQLSLNELNEVATTLESGNTAQREALVQKYAQYNIQEVYQDVLDARAQQQAFVSEQNARVQDATVILFKVLEAAGDEQMKRAINTLTQFYETKEQSALAFARAQQNIGVSPAVAAFSKANPGFAFVPSAVLPSSASVFQAQAKRRFGKNIIIGEFVNKTGETYTEGLAISDTDILIDARLFEGKSLDYIWNVVVREELAHTLQFADGVVTKDSLGHIHTVYTDVVRRQLVLGELTPEEVAVYNSPLEQLAEKQARGLMRAVLFNGETIQSMFTYDTNTFKRVYNWMLRRIRNISTQSQSGKIEYNQLQKALTVYRKAIDFSIGDTKAALQYAQRTVIRPEDAPDWWNDRYDLDPNAHFFSIPSKYNMNHVHMSALYADLREGLIRPSLSREFDTLLIDNMEQFKPQFINKVVQTVTGENPEFSQGVTQDNWLKAIQLYFMTKHGCIVRKQDGTIVDIVNASEYFNYDTFKWRLGRLSSTHPVENFTVGELLEEQESTGAPLIGLEYEGLVSTLNKAPIQLVYVGEKTPAGVAGFNRSSGRITVRVSSAWTQSYMWHSLLHEVFHLVSNTYNAPSGASILSLLYGMIAYKQSYKNIRFMLDNFVEHTSEQENVQLTEDLYNEFLQEAEKGIASGLPAEEWTETGVRMRKYRNTVFAPLYTVASRIYSVTDGETDAENAPIFAGERRVLNLDRSQIKTLMGSALNKNGFVIERSTTGTDTLRGYGIFRGISFTANTQEIDTILSEDALRDVREHGKLMTKRLTSQERLTGLRHVSLEQDVPSNLTKENVYEYFNAQIAQTPDVPARQQLSDAGFSDLFIDLFEADKLTGQSIITMFNDDTLATSGAGYTDVMDWAVRNIYETENPVIQRFRDIEDHINITIPALLALSKQKGVDKARVYTLEELLAVEIDNEAVKVKDAWDNSKNAGRKNSYMLREFNALTIENAEAVVNQLERGLSTQKREVSDVVATEDDGEEGEVLRSDLQQAERGGDLSDVIEAQEAAKGISEETIDRIVERALTDTSRSIGSHLNVALTVLNPETNADITQEMYTGFVLRMYEQLRTAFQNAGERANALYEAFTKKNNRSQILKHFSEQQYKSLVSALGPVDKQTIARIRKSISSIEELSNIATEMEMDRLTLLKDNLKNKVDLQKTAEQAQALLAELRTRSQSKVEKAVKEKTEKTVKRIREQQPVQKATERLSKEKRQQLSEREKTIRAKEREIRARERAVDAQLREAQPADYSAAKPGDANFSLRLVDPRDITQITTSEIQIGSEDYKNEERLQLGYENIIQTRHDALTIITNDNVRSVVDNLTDPARGLTEAQRAIRSAVLVWLMQDGSLTLENRQYVEKKALDELRLSGQQLNILGKAMRNAKDVVNPVKSAKDAFVTETGIELTLTVEDTGFNVTDAIQHVNEQLEKIKKAVGTSQTKEEAQLSRDLNTFYQGYKAALERGDIETAMAYQYEEAIRNQDYNRIIELNQQLAKNMAARYEKEHPKVKFIDVFNPTLRTAAMRNLAETLTNLRFFSMLSNPATLLRNEVGNAMQWALNEVTFRLQSLFDNDADYQRWNKDKQQYRETTSLPIETSVDEYVDQNYVSNGLIKYVVQGNRYDTTFDKNAYGQFLRGKPKFEGLLGKILNKPAGWIADTLSSRDQIWVGKQFASNLRRIYQANIQTILSDAKVQYMRDHNIRTDAGIEEHATKRGNAVMLRALAGDTAAILELTPKHTLEVLSRQAYNMAMETYFRNNNGFYRIWSELARKSPAVNLVFAAINPFMRVSSNIFLMAYNYSPLKWVEVFGKYIKNKQMMAETYKGAVTGFEQAGLTRAAAQAAVGTVLTIVGIALASAGLLDIDDEEYMGIVLKLGDIKVRISDLAPAATSMAVGAALISAQKQDKKAFEEMLTVVYDQTMLGNFNELLEFNDSLQGVLGSMVETYLTQYIPAIVRNVSRMLTNSAVKKKSGAFKFLQNLADATPFRTLLPDKIDPYTGETMKRFKSGFIGEFFNIINPIQVRLSKKSALQREAEEYGSTTTGPSGSFKINGKDYKLLGKDLEQFSKFRAKYIASESQELIATREYKSADADEKARLLKALYAEATTVSKINYWVSLGNRYTVNDREDYLTIRKYVPAGVTYQKKQKSGYIGD